MSYSYVSNDNPIINLIPYTVTHENISKLITLINKNINELYCGELNDTNIEFILKIMTESNNV
jgi:hypothetical protein